jgi:hypothetical protein
MTNIKFNTEKTKLTIEVNLDEEHGISKSGKSISVASTNGNVEVVSDDVVYHVGVNVYKSKK